MRGVLRAGRARWRVVRVEARAKLNLGLAVGPRRPDGYHELATIFQSISLADQLTFRPRQAGFMLAVRSDSREVGAIPRGRANLVLSAADLMRETFGIPGAAIRLDKRIPAASGLGGASADAAGTLLGLARLYGLRPGRITLSPPIRHSAAGSSRAQRSLESRSCRCNHEGPRVRHAQPSQYGLVFQLQAAIVA